ncbi:MAG: PCMD domain-containing protein [Tannerellaceae bacterium]|jgi:hypothetical protein|nr:PCMD domain-containing protein [Tannerellaceae bacterium]
MKFKLSLTLWLSVLLITGCIQDEPLSPYADIDAFSLPDQVALSAASFNQGNISIYVKKGADLSSIVPAIRISEGATIAPDPVSPQNFSKEVTYTVTAADGKHQREYVVQAISVSQYKYDFEYWEGLDMYGSYETPVEYDLAGKRTTPWDSSNRGINLYVNFTRPDQYPIHKTTASTSGQYAAEMVTMKGPGNVIKGIYIPVAAGSLFIGAMNPLYALKDPLLATRFGQPFYNKPLRLSGKYKYRAGAGDYIDPNGQVRPGVRDSCAIYSVFFRVDSASMMLDGTNILTHPNIVSLAMLPPDMRAVSEGTDFVTFDIPFEKRSNQVVDFERNSYKLAIIFTSSFYGDRYEGAVGSRLIVDEIEVIIEE